MPRIRNKEYDKKYLKEWRKKNPEKSKEASLKSYYKHRENRLKSRNEKYATDSEYRKKHRASNREWLYGITQEQYDILLETQNGLCAICKKIQESKKTKNLYVDHNHKTGRIRGLLCQKCNSAIGLVGESINILEKIINYLKIDAEIS